jgi:hypothetical protein
LCGLRVEEFSVYQIGTIEFKPTHIL